MLSFNEKMALLCLRGGAVLDTVVYLSETLLKNALSCTFDAIDLSSICELKLSILWRNENF